jgi:hypothetical protein
MLIAKIKGGTRLWLAFGVCATPSIILKINLLFSKALQKGIPLCSTP